MSLDVKYMNKMAHMVFVTQRDLSTSLTQSYGIIGPIFLGFVWFCIKCLYSATLQIHKVLDRLWQNDAIIALHIPQLNKSIHVYMYICNSASATLLIAKSLSRINWYLLKGNIMLQYFPFSAEKILVNAMGIHRN